MFILDHIDWHSHCQHGLSWKFSEFSDKIPARILLDVLFCVLRFWPTVKASCTLTSLSVVQHEKRNLLFPSSHKHNVLIYQVNTNAIPKYFTETVFGCKKLELWCNHGNGDLFTCVNNNVTFMWEDIMFLHRSSPDTSLMMFIQ